MADAEEMMEGVTLAPASTITPTPLATSTTAEAVRDVPKTTVPLLNKPATQRLPITVPKPIPYTFDLAHLLATDANPLPPQPSEDILQSTARDGAQALINQLLTTCPITSSSAGVLLELPAPSTPLPREKPVPALKALTKWQQFAAKKGITPKKKEGKMVYDEESGEWVPKWGYKGVNKKGEGEWLVEINDDKSEKKKKGGGKGSKSGVDDEEGNPRSEKRRERIERGKRVERKMRANERVQRKGGSGIGSRR
ncbi:MAG: hypothetical protein M1823_002572 [Watsoniomyces obsoletus]|nr:MAG: hypothetical protein M1823_002572 [Watsoniomyces obsoletus]